MRKLLLLFGFLGLLSFELIAQSTGDYRSFTSGDWSNVSTWERFNGSVWVNPAPTSPTSADGAITILNTHNVKITVDVTIDQTTVQAGGSLNVDPNINFLTVNVTLNNGSGDDLILNGLLTLSDDGFSEGGNLTVNGSLLVNTGGSITINTPALSTLLFSAGSTYQHNKDGGVVPTSTWSSTSTCLFTGITTGVPTGLTQTFGNFTWTCASQGATINLGLTSSSSFAGSFTVTNTNGRILSLNSVGSATIDVSQDFSVSGTSRFAITNNSTVTLRVSRDFLYTTTGSSTLSGAGGTGNIEVKRHLNISSGTLVKSGGGGSTFTFNGTGTQNYTGGSIISGPINYTINNGSTLDLGTSALVGTGNFTLQAGATMKVGSPDGLSTGGSIGNMRVSGTRNYSANGNIIYNGSIAQNLGDEWSAAGALNGIAVNLEIASSNTVTNNIIGSTSLVGKLTLTSGSIAIGNSNTLQVQGNFLGNGGTVTGDATANLIFTGGGSTSGNLAFAGVGQTLSNLTISRAGTLLLTTPLTISGVLAFNSTGNLQFDGQTLTINGDITQAGPGGLISSVATSNLAIAGTGILTALPFIGSAQLNNVTLGRTSGGSYTWGSNATVNGTIDLNSGSLAHSTGLTMANGAIFSRSAGTSVTGTAPAAIGNYNVVYNGNLTTSLELPSISTNLNNLTVNGNVTLDKTITVNGTLLLSSGTLGTSTFNLTMAGASFTATSGTYSSGGTTIFSRSGPTTVTGSSLQFNHVTINSGATVLAPSGTMSVSGDWTNSGGFTPNGGMVTFTGAAQNIASNNILFDNVTFAGSSTKTLTQALSVSNTLTISSTLTVGSQNITLGGLWTNNGTFNHGTGTVTFNSSSAIAGSSSTDFENITISGTLTSPVSFNVGGNFVNNGTFTAAAGTVNFNGTTAPQSVTGSTTTFNNIGVTNPFGVGINTTARLNGTLTLVGSGVFDADGAGSGVFIVSSSSQTAGGMIAALPTPANFSGNVTVERYIHSQAGGDWRYLSMPITNGNVSYWKSAFSVTGNFSDPSPSGGNIFDNTQASVYTWNSGTQAYVAVGTGASTVSTAISNTTGYAAYNYNNGAGTASYSGPIGKGSIPISISNTSSNFSLVPNPYPSPIDWDNVDKTKVNNAMWIRTANNIFSSYAGGIPQNAPFGGWTGEIATGQSFWVQSNGVAGTFTLNETDKTSNAYQFLRVSTPENYVRIQLKSATQQDEAVLHFADNATDNLDSDFDAVKKRNGNYVSSLGQNNYLNISTYLASPSADFAINTIAKLAKDDLSKVVKLKLIDVTAGNHTLKFTDLGTMSLGYTIYLEDKFLNQAHMVSEGYEYSFAVTSNPLSSGDSRFSLRFDNPQTITAVEDELMTGTKIYPNPVSDKLFVKLSAEDEANLKQMILFDVMGRVMISSDQSRQLLAPGLKTIDMVDFSSGFYVLYISTGDIVKSIRVIKK